MVFYMRFEKMACFAVLLGHSVVMTRSAPRAQETVGTIGSLMAPGMSAIQDDEPVACHARHVHRARDRWAHTSSVHASPQPTSPRSAPRTGPDSTSWARGSAQQSL